MQSADNKNKNGKSGIQVIARAAAIFRVLRENPEGLSLGKIAKAVNLPRSTVQRITGALADERLVMSDPRGGGIRLGPELGALAEAARFNMVERCRLVLTEVTRATGETTDLAMLRGNGLVFLDQVPGIHRLRTISAVGDVFPLTTTANGRACLALMPDKMAIEIAHSEWDRSKARPNPEALLSTLNEIRQTGLAYDLEEHSEDISAIGIAFRDWGGDLYAISVPVPASRFRRTRDKIAMALLTAKQSIDEMIGEVAK